MRLWLLKKLLGWYKRVLEKQINFKRWDRKLSAKIDAVAFLQEALSGDS